MKRLKYTAVGLIALFAGVALTSCGAGDNADKTDKTANQTEILKKNRKAGSESAVFTLTSEDLYAPGKPVDRLTVLDFNAVWCIPCRRLAPVFDASAEHYPDKVTFVSVDIDSFPEVAKRFDIKGVPTVVIIKPDGTSESFTGTDKLLPAEKFDDLIQKALK